MTCWTDLIEHGAERDDLILAFGGGVVGDLTGLAAGLLKRGARFVQIPTTLLAQVDSSVGGKTAINSRAGKNMVGLFHQPVLVLADLDVLDTLPERERFGGLAEIAKYALIDDPKFFDFLEPNAAALRRWRQGPAWRRRCACRARPRRGSWRSTRPSRPSARCSTSATPSAMRWSGRTGSGRACCMARAVGAGMAMAMRYSVKLGVCPGQDAVRAEQLLECARSCERGSLISAAAPISPRSCWRTWRTTRRPATARLTLILSRGIGKAYIQTRCQTFPPFAISSPKRLPALPESRRCL